MVQEDACDVTQYERWLPVVAKAISQPKENKAKYLAVFTSMMSHNRHCFHRILPIFPIFIHLKCVPLSHHRGKIWVDREGIIKGREKSLFSVLSWTTFILEVNSGTGEIVPLPRVFVMQTWDSMKSQYGCTHLPPPPREADPSDSLPSCVWSSTLQVRWDTLSQGNKAENKRGLLDLYTWARGCASRYTHEYTTDTQRYIPCTPHILHTHQIHRHTHPRLTQTPPLSLSLSLSLPPLTHTQ